MTIFKPMSVGQRIARLWPPERRRQDERMEAEIRRLMDSPKEPVMVVGVPPEPPKSLQRAVFGFDLF